MKLIIALIILIVLIGALCYAKKKLKELSLQLFGTESIQEGLEKQADEQALTPKSVCGMTRILEPQIEKDFPEFNWEELRAEVEQSVKELLETKNVRSAGVVRIHKTVISRYQKYNGTASILCETAAEYWTKAENQENSQTTARNVRQSAKGQHGQNDAAQQTRKKQTVCEAELIYVYNSSLSGTAASLVCPNCGAPVEELGVKKCRYCGSVLEVSGARSWKVQNVRERN